MTVPHNDPLDAVERDLLNGLGWSCSHPDRSHHDRRAVELGRNLDPQLIGGLARRRIAELLAGQLAEHGACSWSVIRDLLMEANDQDALAELLHVLTANGWPAAVPLLLEHLQTEADRRRRWQAALDELSDLAGQPVKVTT